MFQEEPLNCHLSDTCRISTRYDHVSVIATGTFEKGLRYRVKLGQHRTPTWQIPSVRIENTRMRTWKIPGVRTDIKLRQSGRFHLLESYIVRIQKSWAVQTPALFSIHFFTNLYTVGFIRLRRWQGNWEDITVDMNGLLVTVSYQLTKKCFSNWPIKVLTL